jgi:hypothetical protein
VFIDATCRRIDATLLSNVRNASDPSRTVYGSSEEVKVFHKVSQWDEAEPRGN